MVATQKLEILGLDLKRLKLIWVNPRSWNSLVKSKKAGTSLGKSQMLEILWLDIKRLELIWVNPRSWKFYGWISKGSSFFGQIQKAVISMVRS